MVYNKKNRLTDNIFIEETTNKWYDDDTFVEIKSKWEYWLYVN